MKKSSAFSVIFVRTGSTLAIILLIALFMASCGREARKKRHLRDQHLKGAVNQKGNLPFDSNLLNVFYSHFPRLGKYKPDVSTLYRNNKFTHIWFDEKGPVEFGQTLYGKVQELGAEGVVSRFQYQDEVDAIYRYGNENKQNKEEIKRVREDWKDNTLSRVETELMLTNLYLFYAENVYKGLADSTTMALGWLLPRKQVSYTNLLDSLVRNPRLMNEDDSVLLKQYYRMRIVLAKYREIEKKGGWKAIETPPGFKEFRPGDTGNAILRIKERLAMTGEFSGNIRSNVFDTALVRAVKEFQLSRGNNPVDLILPQHISELNRPVGDLIQSIIVNMERCRWIPPEFAAAKEYIVVNIPSFELNVIRNDTIALNSPVVVGRNVSKTVIFSGMLTYIVFSPYWNVPADIYRKEIKPGMERNPDYLASHNMEIVDGQARQKPGRNNSLGQVKFIFPNSNDIYIHDTPAKSLFAKESRAFSHGCIRVGKPRDLALELLRDDPAWTHARIDAAMNSGVEYTYTLKTKIPVYIGYFTCWIGASGRLYFYNDIYGRDGNLARLVFDRESK